MSKTRAKKLTRQKFARRVVVTYEVSVTLDGTDDAGMKKSLDDTLRSAPHSWAMSAGKGGSYRVTKVKSELLPIGGAP